MGAVSRRYGWVGVATRRPCFTACDHQRRAWLASRTFGRRGEQVARRHSGSQHVLAHCLGAGAFNAHMIVSCIARVHQGAHTVRHARATGAVCGAGAGAGDQPPLHSAIRRCGGSQSDPSQIPVRSQSATYVRRILDRSQSDPTGRARLGTAACNLPFHRRDDQGPVTSESRWHVTSMTTMSMIH